MSIGFTVKPPVPPQAPPVLAAPGQPKCKEKHPSQGYPCDRPPGHEGGHLNKVADLYWQAQAKPHCGARWPNRGPGGGWWTCTLDKGHEDGHEAGVPADGRPFYSSIPQDDDEVTWDAP